VSGVWELLPYGMAMLKEEMRVGERVEGSEGEKRAREAEEKVEECVSQDLGEKKLSGHEIHQVIGWPGIGLSLPQ
jgi:hypothetical protein